MKRLLAMLLLIVALSMTIPLADLRHVVAASYTFTNPQVLQIISGEDKYPQALQTSDGTIWVAWQHYFDKPYYMTWNSNTWSSVKTLPTGSQFSISPSLGQLRNSSIILFWSSNQTGRWNIFYKLYSGGVWGNAAQLTSGAFDDFFPTVAVATNSTAWLFWERITSSTSYQIYYKTLTGNRWSNDILLSTGTNQDDTPSALATYDGRIWVTWSRYVSGNYDVFYRYFNGVQWSPETLLTNANTWDLEPSIVQDRNGTIWVFWSRQMQLSSGANAVYQQKLWYKNSYNSGVSWSPDTQLTFYGDVNTPIDDLEPWVVQGIDKTLWIFYSSDYPLGNDFEIYYIKSNVIINHDVALTKIQAPPFWYPGGMKAAGENPVMKINVTVANNGGYDETVQVSLSLSNATIYNLPALSGTVLAGKSAIFTFNWNTTLVNLGWYNIQASVTPVPGEINTSDNSLSLAHGTRIVPLGDVTQDGRIDIIDASIAKIGYGSSPGAKYWNPYADIDDDGFIGTVDIAFVIAHYGTVS